MSKKSLIIWIVLFAGAALWLAFYLSHKIEESFKTEETGNALIGGQFSLKDTKGNSVASQKFLGRYMLVYFGYSFCPDICPTGLENMTEAMNILGDDGKKVQAIFITVDPKRDTEAQLAVFMESFHPSFIALTGSESAVKRAMQAYRVYASPVEDKGSSEYLVDHSSIVYLMGPDGKFVTHFTHQTPGSEMAFKIREILK
jgi:cytochrome oxidase Cu insertion factor (SCO1/SenC/PrrC family)